MKNIILFTAFIMTSYFFKNCSSKPETSKNVSQDSLKNPLQEYPLNTLIHTIPAGLAFKMDSLSDTQDFKINNHNVDSKKNSEIYFKDKTFEIDFPKFHNLINSSKDNQFLFVQLGIKEKKRVGKKLLFNQQNLLIDSIDSTNYSNSNNKYLINVGAFDNNSHNNLIEAYDSLYSKGNGIKYFNSKNNLGAIIFRVDSSKAWLKKNEIILDPQKLKSLWIHQVSDFNSIRKYEYTSIIFSTEKNLKIIPKIATSLYGNRGQQCCPPQ